MSANTISMYFRLEPSILQKEDVWTKLEQLGVLVLGDLTGEATVIELESSKDRLIIFPGQDGSHATCRVYSHGLVTLDIQHYVGTHFYCDHTKKRFNLSYIRALEKTLVGHLGEICKESNSLYCPIRRGQTVWPYAVTADERVLEFDYDDLVYEKTSRWQNIRIFHSLEHGNVLFLDGDAMLAESDLIYTQTLCCLGQENYRNKEVLILGGGDGGILHELLKEKPKFVLMAEIDEEVVKACRTHMRSVCGDSMDKFEGPNYKIEIDDCVKVLHESIQNGKRYDYVINDLTEFPVDKVAKGFGYDFETTSLITELSIKTVKPGGKILARGNCLSAVDYRENFESDLQLMRCQFKRKDILVPSFQETYCIYEIWCDEDFNGVSKNEQGSAATS